MDFNFLSSFILASQPQSSCRQGLSSLFNPSHKKNKHCALQETPKPSSSKFVQPLTTSSDIDSNAFTCPICIDDIIATDMAMKCPRNGHFFHSTCLQDWMVHQQKQNFDGQDDLNSTARTLHSATCPVCREELTSKAAKFSNYLRDPNYNQDERKILERLALRWRVYKEIFFKNRRTAGRSVAVIFVFLFGLFKGVSLRQWTFTQDIIYFALPYRMRIFTTLGYVLGLMLRASLLLISHLRSGQKNLSDFLK